MGRASEGRPAKSLESKDSQDVATGTALCRKHVLPSAFRSDGFARSVASPRGWRSRELEIRRSCTLRLGGVSESLSRLRPGRLRRGVETFWFWRRRLGRSLSRRTARGADGLGTRGGGRV